MIVSRASGKGVGAGLRYLIPLLVLFLAACLVPACDEGESGSPVPPETSESNVPQFTPSPEETRSPAPVPTASDTGETVSTGTPICTAMALSDAFARIVERVEKAVVFISAEIETESFFFGKTIQESSGSGVIVSSDGHILTNNHVVEGAVRLEVTLPGVLESFEARIVGTDPLTDLAVLDIEGEGFPVVPFGNASVLRPGNLVLAMGYPLALDQGATITLGVVSNTERSFTVGDSTYYDVIQTDAAINRGNSGGPLLDLNGEIVGINSVLFGGAQNIGFAISANMARPVYEALISEEHRVRRPWLGVMLADVTPDLAADADLPRQYGVVLSDVVADSPADKAGLKVRDVITMFNGQEVTTASQLIKKLWEQDLGTAVTITYWRGDKEEETTIFLSEERPSP